MSYTNSPNFIKHFLFSTFLLQIYVVYSILQCYRIAGMFDMVNVKSAWQKNGEWIDFGHKLTNYKLKFEFGESRTIR